MRFDVRGMEDVDALENQLRMSGKLTPIGKVSAPDERSIQRVEDIPSVFGFAKGFPRVRSGRLYTRSEHYDADVGVWTR